MISIGSMDKLCFVEKPTYTNNANYGGIQSVAYAATPSVGNNKIYAAVEYKGGKEQDDGEQKVGEIAADFYIRYEKYKESIEQNWRIYYVDSSGNNKYYYIESIAFIDGRHKITKLRAVNKEVE
tara:strand:- start:848 stop:1219 length:372 start_codon:yes stop_codon:yes gene_type:complete